MQYTSWMVFPIKTRAKKLLRGLMRLTKNVSACWTSPPAMHPDLIYIHKRDATFTIFLQQIIGSYLLLVQIWT